MSKVLIIGGGAAGMMAGVFAARNHHKVHILEKNEKLGKKIFITGKGRCNVTNACDTEELFPAMMSNPKFLYSSFYSFTPQDVMEFFEEAGVPLKVERGNRVFPQSDHSSDIIRALERELKKAGAKIHLRTSVKEIVTESETDSVTGVNLTDDTFMEGDAVIVATGGFSYQSTGSTGDGYRFARELGLKVTDIAPSLVPLKTKEDYIPKLQGLSLKNTGLTIKNGKKVLYEDFGEMMFTHFGVTGPMILSASAHIGAKLAKAPNGELSAYLDLKPALTREQLDARILREFEAGPNKQFKNVIGVLFPSSLTPVMLELGGIPAEKKIHDISREERQYFIDLIKAFPFTITGMGEFKEAIITRGGVSVKEINPGTMESKKISGLYFAGEVLDLDAVTGGYNLQIAWSTAYLAAQAIQ
ncbi:BaiN/RdsA family NAD(P)/FAD-dependent oxidoreductase [Blautia difficilis]|uniref:NAD(P)/FAD-dependent oxidoreductase n=1 Tax=Blautia difficilis TaxID=2763027 RepID=A0ABR7IHZ4_9FIRM|nr:NAD(P)/FAD-dependent oxidoreductase [Blautia difficilis]MBC5779618.1 NAD(P)/FAD-dependent oxidoreductase [Blautia difficilis]